MEEECKKLEDHAVSECEENPKCEATKKSDNTDSCVTDRCRKEGLRAADCEPREESGHGSGNL